MPELDYPAIKQAVSIEKAARFLDLPIKQHNDTFRCGCPICERAGDRAIVITPGIGRWYCHGGCKKGGDAIYLVAHIKGIKQSEAAQLLQDQFMREPEKPKASKSSQRKTAKPRAASKASKVSVGGSEEYSIVDWLQL